MLCPVKSDVSAVATEEVLSIFEPISPVCVACLILVHDSDSLV